MMIAVIALAVINLVLFTAGLKEYGRFKRSEEYECKDEFKFRSLMHMGYGALRIIGFSKYRGRVFEIHKHRFGSVEKTVCYYRAYISNLITACVVLGDIIASFAIAYIRLNGFDIDLVYLCVLGVVAIAAIVYGQYKQNLSAEKTRTDSMLCELPNIVNKITVFQASGLPMETILQRIALEGGEEKNPIYRELEMVAMDISNGKGAVKAIHAMQQRCKRPEISRFASAIVQNLTHGTADCAQVLEGLADEMWRMRRSVDKIRGQKIKEMMLIPTLICFAIVMVIVITPAFMGLDRFV